MELQWWSIEVFDGDTMSAALWRDAYGGVLIEAAITHGAYDWEWHLHSWGALFEVGFRSEGQFETYRDLPAVRAALDAVPDPVNGLLVYRGRGGSSGRVQPRMPRPIAGAGGAEIPREPEIVRLVLAHTEPAPTEASFTAA
jgi:hypothetical protein